jgi:hypothetical protein
MRDHDRSRRWVALLLCSLLGLEACTTAHSDGRVPMSAASRSVADGAIELKADPDAERSLPDEEAGRLRQARVIPVRLVVSNAGITFVTIRSAAIALELSDGRRLEAIQGRVLFERVAASTSAPAGEPTPSPGTTGLPTPTDERPADTMVDTPRSADPTAAPTQSPAPTSEEPSKLRTLLCGRGMPPSNPGSWSDCAKDAAVGRGEGRGLLAGLLIYPAIILSPIWVPYLLISHSVDKRRAERDAKQGGRNFALKQLEEVTLAKGESADAILYFGHEGDLSATAATATLVVPVRDADTGEERVVRLALGSASR